MKIAFATLLILLMSVSAALAQPPTPTFFPTPNPDDFLVDIPEKSMWGFADSTVGTWNAFGRARTEIFQVVVLLFVIIVSISLVIRMLKKLRSERDEE